MDEILSHFLQRLEELGRQYEELYDSDVRQAIGNAVMDGFVRARAGFVVPTDLGMFSEKANGALREAIQGYLAAANERAGELGIVAFRDRLAAVQRPDVRTPEGNDYDEFLGHSPPEFFDDIGNVIRTI
jgi:hypothetical protein